MRASTAACLITLLASLTEVHAMFDGQEVCDPKPSICGASKKGKNFVLVPKKTYKIWANGCGTDSLGFQVMGNEAMDFTSCCNWHDACYGVCGISKKTCEKRFEKCMKDQCAATAVDESARKSCESTAELYAMGPKFMGCQAFTAGQKEACDCVDTSKADTKHRGRLQHFLSEYAKAEEKEEVDTLLTKYKGKEPTMFLRLLAKYPHALTIKKKKVTETDTLFENLRKQAQDSADVGDAADPADVEPVEEHIEL